MPDFAPVITDYWSATFSGKLLHRNGYLTITVSPDLDDDERVSVLRGADDGRVAIAVSPAIADSLAKDIAALDNPTETDVRAALAGQGVALSHSDNVFYLTDSAADDILGDPGPPNVRQLTEADAGVTASFKAAAPEENWAVFGAFDEHARLVGIGSMSPWDDEFPIADVDVRTTGSARGRRQAKTLVRAMFRHALTEGYEPQYRCPPDDAASMKLAASLDLQLFGSWETVKIRR